MQLSNSRISAAGLESLDLNEQAHVRYQAAGQKYTKGDFGSVISFLGVWGQGIRIPELSPS